MKSHEMYPSKYLSGPEMKGKTAKVTVDRYEMEQMADGDMKPVLYFKKAKKAMVLNKTNADTLFAVEEDAKNWGGIVVEVYFDPSVSFAGKKTGGLRLRALSSRTTGVPDTDEPPMPEEPSGPEYDEDGNEIPF